MNESTTSLYESLHSWRQSMEEGAEQDEPPLRSELFSAAQMAAHGAYLSTRHALSKKGGPDRLLARLRENDRLITETCGELTAAIKAGRLITPASEWLLDNFYLIEEQIRTARRHLPKHYSRELPRLANREAGGNPRVYQLALEIISHGDGRVDPESLARFVVAYQERVPLKLGELWAIPIMLRLALIENLRRVAARVAANRAQRDLANSWADQLGSTADQRPSELILKVADMARSKPPMTSGFVAELARRLQGQSPALALALQWVSTRLADVGLSIEQQIQAEIGQQAADQVSVSNSIGSLRFLGTMDWQEFVETMSPVEQCLRLDPADVYGKMDFATRDHCRHVVEKLAKRCLHSEVEVARQAADLAREPRAPSEGGLDARQRHVGYYLIGGGRALLEQRLCTRNTLRDAVARAARRHPLSLYVGSIVLLSALFAASVGVHALNGGMPWWPLLAFSLLGALAASQLALALVNFMATQLTRPHPLPRMDFEDGIPADAHTLVAVPALIYSKDNIATLCEDLEVRFLANRDPQLRFCLLSDFADAPSETMDGDAALLEQARASIAALNAKYAYQLPEQTGSRRILPFLLMHRPRRWNAGERAWIGKERKRGKLGDLNAYLRGGARDCFSLVEGDTTRLQEVRYVITLDADTKLPRDAARAFVASMAHPLNHALVDTSLGRVVEGYGILQPRVAASLPAERTTPYERLCGGEPGIDPYTRTVSDVYQDVFHEGSFVGKGIYAVDTFEQVLGARLPDNRILSHDLLEGCYLRAGLLSDAQLYEAYPASYSEDVARRQRWMRGDWQLAGWLWPRVPGRQGKRERNPLSALSRWKIFDNLRRSVVPAALTVFLLSAWFLLPRSAFWSGVVAGAIVMPAALGTLIDLLEKPRDALWRQHVPGALQRAGVQWGHAVLGLAFLPYEAVYSLDAVLRSAWRMLVSKRNLLQWRASGMDSQRQDQGAYWQRMWCAPALALLIGAALWWAPQTHLAGALPILFLWLCAPGLAWWISRPMARTQDQLTAQQTQFLQSQARKTWAFFDTYVGPEDNWLPPDNMQEQPTAVVAHRTSPTNIGMSLLANLTAWDFGFVGLRELLLRTENSFASLDKMERYQGHFYNWYDTLTLAPLQPMYVSAVDSGNLAGHLLTLAPGLDALAEQPILGEQVFEGIAITLRVLAECDEGMTGTLKVQLQGMASRLQPEQLAPGRPLAATVDALIELDEQAQAIEASVNDSASLPTSGPLRNWAAALRAQTLAAKETLFHYLPWLSLAPEAAGAPLLHMPTLRALAELPLQAGPDPEWTQACARGSARAADTLLRIAELAARARAFARMEFSFLYNPTTKLLAIGYNASDRRLDAACYDLLASEIRLCSFVAIAQGQLPQEHWFALGRQLCFVSGEAVLLSWSGSMFEYLMPLLVMPSYPNTLLEHTYRAVIHAQIDYGKRRDVPWGISESGYNTVDASLNYQYRAFGVPGLGLQRGLGDDLVIAPYASMLALMVAPQAACANLQRLASLGFAGRYGFYEAIDYTQARLPRSQHHAVVRSYMAHHQGMGLLAMSYLLHQRPMQRRFESDPLFQATLLVLQERVPKAGAFYSNTSELAALRASPVEAAQPLRILQATSPPQPEVQLLSNGRYHVMVTSSGGSYSRWKDLAVTRWREDGTCDHWGSFCYLRDADSGALWSNTYQPTRAEPKRFEVIFSEGRAEFRREDRGIGLYTEMVVSPEDDIELRRMRITNNSNQRRTLELTSYAEVALATPAADAAHPAFNKLFVQTEVLEDEHAILCTRRPRSHGEQAPWLLHVMTVHDAPSAVSFETSRANFIGRGRNLSAPQALLNSGLLNGSAGSVLDPIVAIRHRIELAPDQQITVDIVMGMCEQRAAALHLIDKYQDRHLADRVFELAWTHSQVVLRQLNASETDAQHYARLASNVIYPQAQLRAEAGVLARNQRGQSGLWAYAISGDLPIVLMQIRDPANIELVRQLVQAHAYWRLKGLVVDLVIWYEDLHGYRQALHDQIMGLIASGIDAQAIDRPGGIFVRLLDQIAPEDRILMQTVARAILSDQRGTLAEQLRRAALPSPRIPVLSEEGRPHPAGPLRRRPADLLFDNGQGGFSPDGREYLVWLEEGAHTPAPWSNVLANPQFGSVVSESGQAYTWSENAHEFRLTPWHNDPVTDAGGEAFYLRDEHSGRYWSPSPLPVRGSGPYLVRHGFGYSVFEHAQEGIASTLTTFVALDAAVKYWVLDIHNEGVDTRRLSATGYVEWVLGDARAKSAMHVITELDAVSGAVLARNSYNTEFPGRVGFFQVDAPQRTCSADRHEFIGRHGSLATPAAMRRVRLSGRVGAALDPCAALSVPLELAPGQRRSLVFVLGMGGRRNADASGMVQRYQGAASAAQALAQVRAHWQKVLGAVQVETPEPALDVLANGWLMYQTIACRLWARSGYYQSGGAFGFRDQLQDAMAAVHTQPSLLREQLLLCAGHQFVEGDVQHWWHPPSDRGVRTRCSDDYLWLPLAAARYVLATGDHAVLNEQSSFLEGRAVKADEDSYYDMPARAAQTADLYEHCVRAIEHGLRLGEHGLPLIGTCDWNDGMDRVGHEGRGESVWLAWFLIVVLQDFARLAEQRSDSAFAERCRSAGRDLARNIEQHAWDGAWYRRAYFDDGRPLGSRENDECQIDSISQSWGVLSGAAPAERARSAMQAVDARLVRRDVGIVQLLDPPFDKGGLDPGYIRGYVPGVRENGGQYTHAAIWAAMAFAKMGEVAKAWELLRMLNPLQHDPQRYKVEPYVVAADVYAVAPHTGRGGWTWYTGSSGWMYRLILESLLGLERRGASLLIDPRLPPEWPACTVRYRFGASTYVLLLRPGMGRRQIDLIDDGATHDVDVASIQETATLMK